MAGARPYRPESDAPFLPAPDLEAWARKTFISEHGGLGNPAHAHLEFARLGFLWATPRWRRKGREVLATAETGGPPPSITGWKRDRLMGQVEEWFGPEPLDFVVTVWAPAWDQLSDRAACALIEHELYHCGQAIDKFGAPRFRQSGLPMFVIRGHDVEEFSGVVERYGDWSESLADLRRAFEATDKRAQGIRIAGACGTCRAA